MYKFHSRAWRPLLIVVGIVLNVVRVVLGQQTHRIEVGKEGSFFVPATVSAEVDDTIEFNFVADWHSVIQGSLNNPCVMLPGGFSSGVVERTNDTVPAWTWNLTITDTTEPIWFFCGNTYPASHCASGMVGAINPPSQSIFQDFVTASKNVPTSTEQNYTWIVLAGQGAYATQGPAPPAGPSTTTTFSSSSTLSSTSTPSSTSPTLVPALNTTTSSSFTGPTSALDPRTSSNPSPHHPLDRRKIAAIVASSVGGGISVLLLSFLGFVLCRRYRRRRGSDDFFKYKGRSLDLGGPKRRLSFVPSKMIAAAPKPLLGAGDWEGRGHPFVRMSGTPATPGDSLWRVSYRSNSLSRGAPDPVVVKPRTRSGEQGDKNDAAASSISPAGARVPPPPHVQVNAEPGPSRRKLSRRVTKLRLHQAPAADQAPGTRKLTRRATAPPIVTTRLQDTRPVPWVYTPTTPVTGGIPTSTSTSTPANGKPRPSPSSTRPASRLIVAGPRPLRPLPRLPSISPPRVTVASRAPGLKRMISTRALERIDEQTAVDVAVQVPSRERKFSDDPPPDYDLHGAEHRFVPFGTGEG